MNPEEVAVKQQSCPVCPVWIGYVLASPIRKLIHPPEKILGPFIKRGMTVMDVGCAMGYFSLPAAGMVGANGRVLCLDMQPGMLSRVTKRATAAGLSDRIETRLCKQDSLGVEDYLGKVDLAVAFAMVHETPNPEKLIREISACLKPKGRLFVAEPKGHVTESMFEDTTRLAEASGLALLERPKVKWSHAAVYQARG